MTDTTKLLPCVENDDLRELAVRIHETLRDIPSLGIKTQMDEITERIETILAALQSVQKAERAKAEGLRAALLNVIDLMDGAPEDVVGYIKQELASYDSATNGEGGV